MDGKILARIGAIVLVAVAVVATAIEIDRNHASSGNVTTQDGPVTTRDPLDGELQRCSRIGEAGVRDASCLKAWAQNRRRFLGQPAPGASPAPPAPATLFQYEWSPADQALPDERAGPGRVPVPSQNGVR